MDETDATVEDQTEDEVVDEARRYGQADDEAVGEDFRDTLERLGMTEDEYWESTATT